MTALCRYHFSAATNYKPRPPPLIAHARLAWVPVFILFGFIYPRTVTIRLYRHLTYVDLTSRSNCTWGGFAMFCGRREIQYGGTEYDSHISLSSQRIHPPPLQKGSFGHVNCWINFTHLTLFQLWDAQSVLSHRAGEPEHLTYLPQEIVCFSPPLLMRGGFVTLLEMAIVRTETTLPALSTGLPNLCRMSFILNQEPIIYDVWR